VGSCTGIQFTKSIAAFLIKVYRLSKSHTFQYVTWHIGGNYGGNYHNAKTETPMPIGLECSIRLSDWQPHCF